MKFLHRVKHGDGELIAPKDLSENPTNQREAEILLAISSVLPKDKGAAKSFGMQPVEVNLPTLSIKFSKEGDSIRITMNHGKLHQHIGTCLVDLNEGRDAVVIAQVDVHESHKGYETMLRRMAMALGKAAGHRYATEYPLKTEELLWAVREGFQVADAKGTAHPEIGEPIGNLITEGAKLDESGRLKKFEAAMIALKNADGESISKIGEHIFLRKAL